MDCLFIPQRKFLNVLPPPLQREETLDQHSTTTGKAHNYKPCHTVLSNAIHKKAAGHWKVGYVEDLIKKVSELQYVDWENIRSVG